ncbi:hypothetical protein N7509_011595 [Penicillium cosmopolitanum]|uniref:Uncharacterized protein n=1 Tax=Penicillium cosmopolitanum TaxID=1131564 RepID=A0A9W9VGG7_9EURO|nr:uncharacterized protein N7509_011595 [Penicillium cosmopolitanum]KAJ5378476.1 hypothetical protein N7509_011595 [Penicillium cosmopolitanum]
MPSQYEDTRTSRPSGSKVPEVTLTGPQGALMVVLLTYNGSPFKDHWAYFVESRRDPEVGVMIQANGDVLNGFSVEIDRNHDLRSAHKQPNAKIPLQWVDGEHFDEKAMFNNGQHITDQISRCHFEDSACKMNAPSKSLNAVNEMLTPGKKIVQRNCQTWIVESAEQLLKDNISSEEVVAYLHATKQ